MIMDFTIEFYETASRACPVREFLEELKVTDPNDFAAVVAGLAKLRNKQYHREPLAKALGGGLFELRHVGKLNTRVLWFFMKDRRIVAVKYLLAVMNSSVARDFLRSNRRSNIHLYPDDWKKLPIPDVPPEKQMPIVELVEQILSTKKNDPKADTSTLERQIDEIFYALYGLTPEEIAIVEGKK